MNSETLVEVRRGPAVESLHRGHLAAVDGAGRLVASVGDPEAVTFLRSACKPQQALPLVVSGAADALGLGARELAVACASHNGEPMHTEAALSILRKAGLGPGALKCGPHEPYGKEAAEELTRRGEKPAALHNNCSGKHAGMLALAVHIGAPTADYYEREHPVQQQIARSVARFTETPATRLVVGVDGCGLPTYGVTVRAMALMQARLVAPPDGWDGAEREACRRLVSAMLEHPELVEGDGELDTELMRTGAGRIVSKVGAEGVYTAGVLPCGRWPGGLGLAFKIEDGDRGDRARGVVAAEALRQLGVLDADEAGSVKPVAEKAVTKNHRGEEVGEVRAVFNLKVAR